MHALQAHPHELPATLTPLAAETSRATASWVWHSRFGTIVIEVRGKDVFVNGDRVAPHAP